MLSGLLKCLPGQVFGRVAILLCSMALAACIPDFSENEEDTDEVKECIANQGDENQCDPRDDDLDDEGPDDSTPDDSNPGDNTPDEDPVDEISAVAVCAAAGAQCGEVRDGIGNTLSCGSCDTGETCSNNRCEASCGLDQIDNGPFDGLVAYAPLQFSYEDMSENKLDVNTNLLAHEDEGEFTFESSVDMTDKKIDIDFDNQSVSTPMTLSFKMIPSQSNQTALVMQSNSFSIKEDGGAISSKFETQDGLLSLINSNSVLKNRSCNHVAVKIDTNKVTTYLNGQASQMAVDENSIKALTGKLSIGPYPGKVWDVRVFDHALNSADISELGEDCDDANSMPVANEEYPNYLCGVYQCMFWPADVTDTTQESFEYQLSGHDMTWEHNVMTTGMYVHGELCEEYAKPRNLELSEGYRKSWVSKFNFDNPWNQYVLHENFHAYQKRTNGSTKFLAESTASWGAFSMKPTAKDSLLGMYTLQPHLALWTIQDSEFEDGIIDNSKGGHQYGASIFEFYVTHHVLADNAIGKVFNRGVLNLAPLSGKPSEAMYSVLQEGGFDMRDVFADFAARVTTWDMDYGDTFLESEIASFNRMDGNNNKADEPIPSEEVNNKISEFYDVAGTNGQWLTVPSRYKIGSWAFNAYEVDVTENTTYSVGINPSLQNPDYAEFRAQVVVHNLQTGSREYHKLPVTTAGIATSINVFAKEGDKLYLVVSSTPSTKFTDFETYTYDYIIEAQ